jgi:hypothetical protein
MVEFLPSKHKALSKTKKRLYCLPNTACKLFEDIIPYLGSNKKIQGHFILNNISFNFCFWI